MLRSDLKSEVFAQTDAVCFRLTSSSELSRKFQKIKTSISIFFDKLFQFPEVGAKMNRSHSGLGIFDKTSIGESRNIDMS